MSTIKYTIHSIISIRYYCIRSEHNNDDCKECKDNNAGRTLCHMERSCEADISDLVRYAVENGYDDIIDVMEEYMIERCDYYEDWTIISKTDAKKHIKKYGKNIVAVDDLPFENTKLHSRLNTMLLLV